MAQSQDMTVVKQKLEELINALPLDDKDKKELKDFLLTKNDDEMKQMTKLFVDNLTYVKLYWRFKGLKK